MRAVAIDWSAVTGLTVGTLTDDYAGWYLKVRVPGPVGWKHLELKSVRSHDLFSGTVTALVAKDHDGRYAGIEHHFQNGAEVVLRMPVTAKAKRLARYFTSVIPTKGESNARD